MKKMMRFFSLLMAIALIITSLPDAMASDAVVTEIISEPIYQIDVAGDENIKAYMDAGIIPSSIPLSSCNEADLERAARAPTRVWNLANNGDRTSTYSMSSGVYSAYLYNSGPYDDIWHFVYPDQIQSFGIQCYQSDGTAWGREQSFTSDGQTHAFGIRVSNLNNYYFYYRSLRGLPISGSMRIVGQ